MANEMTNGEAKQPRLTDSFSEGLKDGLPIALGYLPVAISFGVLAVSNGLSVVAAVLISMLNVTSAGQFAGLPLLLIPGAAFEMAATQFVINLRYGLMSTSLSQKLSPTINRVERAIIAFCHTDEVFAVASGKPGELGKHYLYGLTIPPYLGWSVGTLLGALVGNILPEIIQNAFGIALYGMFLAIVMPTLRQSKKAFLVIFIAVGMSCCFTYLPVLNQVGSGFSMIISAVVAAAIGATLYPVAPEENGGEKQ